MNPWLFPLPEKHIENEISVSWPNVMIVWGEVEPYPETGFYNYNARLYDPQIGRFLSPDSMIPDPYSSQAYNRYTYVYNNPIRYSDPTGHFVFIPILIGMAIGALVGAVISGGIYAATSSYNNSFSWSGFGIAVGIGAATGLITGGFGAWAGGAAGAISGAVGGLAGDIAAGAATGLIGGWTGYSVTQAFTGQEWNFGDFMLAGGIGMGTGALFGGVSSKFFWQGMKGDGWILTKNDYQIELHSHHIYPQQFRSQFKDAGINIDASGNRINIDATSLSIG